MEQTKDYSLLRPFDLEKAKRGELICWFKNGTRAEYVGECGMYNENDICVKYVDGDGCAIAGTFVMNESRYFRMAPFCWVEGKPVYKGDVLYKDCKKFVVNGMYGPKCVLADEPFVGCSVEKLTWNPPKVKREGWVNVYGYGSSFIYATENDADNNALASRIACVRIEWEE